MRNSLLDDSRLCEDQISTFWPKKAKVFYLILKNNKIIRLCHLNLKLLIKENVNMLLLIINIILFILKNILFQH
jgi:hypothetical protein